MYNLLSVVIICGALSTSKISFASQTPIKVSNRQLLVDGVPFIMKGVCYNPVRKGETEENGLIIASPKAEDLCTIEQDFKMMREAGINTIRTYTPILDRQILNLLSKYKLKTIVPVFSHYPRDNAVETALIINALKNEPSTLIWEIGNEWDLNHFYTHDSTKWRLAHLCHPTSDEVIINRILSSAPVSQELSSQEEMDIIRNLVSVIKEQDNNHPISTNILDPNRTISAPEPTDYNALSDLVDLYGINVYDWLSFGTRFSLWTQLSSKPYYIGEFGADSWNQNNNSYDPSSQDEADKDLLGEVMSNLSAKNQNNILIGGCVFEWNDEWWKDPTGSPDTHDTNGFRPDSGGPFPDHCFTEEWWGIVDIERNPRPSYYAIKKLYTQQSD